MLGARYSPLAALVAAAASVWVSGCQRPDRDPTYNPYVENRGRPTLGSRVEGIPNAMMEGLEGFDSRLENTLY
jgi:hypothetical protein